MKKNLIISLKLTVICLVSVLFLTLVNFLTEGKIKQNAVKTEENANKKLIPDGKKFIKKNFKDIEDPKSENYYYLVENDESLVGYIISAVGKGYGGDMKIMIAVDPNFTIINMKMLKNSETPGIGKKAETDEYMKKFIGTNTPEKKFPENKSMLSQEEKDAITGATITFNGIAKITFESLEMLKKEIKG
ncbi:MAG TPA: RnfABCDGE type electron transport complex subunit G [Spirochaetota bacterium]|nr:RnfABCDGE type electron transport complex subunit G [Spirochaetota bacterium]